MIKHSTFQIFVQVDFFWKINKTEDKNVEEMNTKTKDLQGLIDELKKTQTKIANSEIEMAARVNELYTEGITIFGKLTKVHRHRSCNC